MNLNFLDLRKKVSPQVQIIERVIIQKRSWKSDLFLTLSVIFVASGIIWGISKADTIIQSIVHSQTKNFSVVGIVSNIDATNIYLEQAKGSDDQGKTSYTLDVSSVTKIETNQYASITLSDIKVGDKVVIQGKEDGGNITIKRIISFGLVAPKEEVATTTEAVATTTATSTEPTSTSTESAPTVDTPTIIEKITDAVSNAIDSITGSSTQQTSDPQNLDVQATGTATPATEPTATDTPSIIENVTNTITDTINTVTEAVTNVVQNVIDTVTGSDEQTINPEPTPTEPTINNSESIPAPPTE